MSKNFIIEMYIKKKLLVTIIFPFKSNFTIKIIYVNREIFTFYLQIVFICFVANDLELLSLLPVYKKYIFF